MQLSEFKAVARPRNAWSAIDLGVVMARPYYWRMFFAWIVPALLVYLLSSMFFSDNLWLPICIIWWLKPLFERAILYTISREIFAEPVSLPKVWRNYWGIIKMDLFWWLTIRRFSPTRSFDLPVTMLEQLKGRARRVRLNTLHRRLSSGATWLLITCVHIEGILVFGFYGLLYMLIPQGVEIDWLNVFEFQDATYEHIGNVITVLVWALVAPFYICSGFALYLQRRIDLEGWDVEIRFRDLVERQQRSQKRLTNFLPSIALFFAISLFAGLTITPTTSHAEASSQTTQSETLDQSRDENTAQNYDSSNDENYNLSSDTQNSVSDVRRNSAKEDIQQILLGEDFYRIEVQEGWRFKPQDDTKKAEGEVPEWLIDFADWLSENGGLFSGLASVFRSLSSIVEFLLWLGIGLLIFYIVFRMRHLITRAFRDEARDESLDLTPPKVLFGLDVTEESLPEDVCKSAREAWQAGDPRQALGLLLRSTIIKLIHDHRYPFAEGFTERECAQVVEKRGEKPLSDFFWSVTRAWQKVAYAHRQCSEEVFNQLCVQWQEVFPRGQ